MYGVTVPWSGTARSYVPSRLVAAPGAPVGAQSWQPTPDCVRNAPERADRLPGVDLRVRAVGHPLAGEGGEQVVNRYVGHRLAGRVGRRGDVRRDQQVGGV